MNCYHIKNHVRKTKLDEQHLINLSRFKEFEYLKKSVYGDESPGENDLEQKKP